MLKNDNTFKSVAALTGIIKLQIVLSIIYLIVIAIFTWNINNLLSAILGSVIVILPTIVYIKIAFRRGLVNLPERVIKYHKQAFVTRFVLNLLLFLLIVIFYHHCNFLVLFGAMLVAFSSYWIYLLA